MHVSEHLKIGERADALGAEGLRRAQDAWSELIAEVEAERAAGTDPADPRLDPLIARWTDLIEQFTGGDPGLRASLQRLYDERGPEQASHGAVRGATMAYAHAAIAARAA